MVKENTWIELAQVTVTYLNPVPEPATYGIMGALGLMGSGWLSPLSRSARQFCDGPAGRCLIKIRRSKASDGRPRDYSRAGLRSDRSLG